MTTHHLPLFAFALLACAAHAESPANPPVDLIPVAVGQAAPAPVRFDIRAACPSIDKALQVSLASTWDGDAQSRPMRVDFRVEGARVTRVSVHGAQWDHRKSIRRAVANLDCMATDGAVQNYAFLLVFLDPDAKAPGDRYALVSQ